MNTISKVAQSLDTSLKLKNTDNHDIRGYFNYLTQFLLLFNFFSNPEHGLVSFRMTSSYDKILIMFRKDLNCSTEMLK